MIFCPRDALLEGMSFLIGMKMMSTGLKKCIGRGIRRFFKKTENNPIVSLGIGTVVTAGIQSSDATNAMVIGFINAGAMSLFQGLCIMLGAYIGTTVTGILASFSSLKTSVGQNKVSPLPLPIISSSPSLLRGVSSIKLLFLLIFTKLL